MEEKELKAAHCHCTNNYKELQKSKICGCFYCEKIFNPNEITEWIPDSNLTARCPYCDIDSVIGDASGYPITKSFLRAMHKEWF